LVVFLGLVVVVLAAVLGVRTAALGSRLMPVAAVVPQAVDAAGAAARLASAVRYKTIASPNDEQANAAQFAGLQALLVASFPKAHATLRREVVGSNALLYTWAGSDPKAAPIGLMAHQDVVPVASGTEGDWQQPPFSGAVLDGFVWGRGAWDDKGNLMSIMEAVELLVGSGYVPRQTVYLMFGADEELGGQRGAARIAELLRGRGVRLQFVMDEGLLITQGLIHGMDRPAALVGVAEKGHLSVQLTASAAPGHSSMPPPHPGQSAIGMLSAALQRLEARQMPASMDGLTRQTFESLAPQMTLLQRVVLSNLWLFAPLVERQLEQTASTNATLRTTTALTIVQAGNAENVLPGRATAIVNFRLLPGDSIEQVLAHVGQVVANPSISVQAMPGASEASRVAAIEAPGYRLIQTTLRQLAPDVVVAPGLMLGGTDSRHFEALSDNIYKFSPVRAGPQDLPRFHGTNERISIANYVEMIQFYCQLLRGAQSLG